MGETDLGREGDERKSKFPERAKGCVEFSDP